ncbi:MAG TPA: c-type cytochrome [Thermohalobaculum sp.]|nr:c-type cytochrome [Thermohalobaculum sp.]
MRRIIAILAASGMLTIGALSLALPAGAGGDHKGGHMGGAMMPQDLDEMREMHREHTHGHDFDAMEEMSPEKRARVMALMHEIGVAMPPMDPERGRHVFVEKGCVACHSVNGVGGDLGPALDAADMPRPMNVFEFAARMWRGAPAMAALQEDMLGEVISLDGQELADLVAFAHDADEQAMLTMDQVPERFHSLIEK